MHLENGGSPEHKRSLLRPQSKHLLFQGILWEGTRWHIAGGLREPPRDMLAHKLIHNYFRDRVLIVVMVVVDMVVVVVVVVRRRSSSFVVVVVVVIINLFPWPFWLKRFGLWPGFPNSLPSFCS